MVTQLEAFLLSYATVLPLPVFAALASFAEEIIAPIPSGPVMLVMGSLAQLQGYGIPGLLVLALVAATGKLAGSLVVYLITDKAEDLILTGRIASFLGVTHKQIEAFGKRLGNGWKDYALLLLLRTLPFVPSVVISAGSGLLKIPLPLFISTTFVGSIIRDALFLYVGYIGFRGAEHLFARFDTIESILQTAIVAGVIVAGTIYVYLHQKQRKSKQG